MEAVDWTKHSKSDGYALISSFRSSCLTRKGPTPVWAALREWVVRPTKTSCGRCLQCAEWSCVVLTNQPHHHNGSGRDWPYKSAIRKLAPNSVRVHQDARGRREDDLRERDFRPASVRHVRETRVFRPCGRDEAFYDMPVFLDLRWRANRVNPLVGKGCKPFTRFWSQP